MTRVFAVTTRGLEAVSANELNALPSVTVERIAYRRIFAACEGSLAPLLSLRTVDDIFIYAGTWSPIERARQSLDALKTAGEQLSLDSALSICAELRSINDPPTFSVSANFVGRRNYSTAEIKQACGRGIEKRNGWSYLENEAESDINVRVFIDGRTATVGLRLGAGPLSRRSYKRDHVPGSLKPPVAAALLALADVTLDSKILDPCCGAGTILIEAGMDGADAWGGDIHRRAVEASHSNAVQADVIISTLQWDARALPVPKGSFGRIISNLPWGRAVNIEDDLQTVYGDICGEIERVLAPGGKAVLLTNLPALLVFERLKCEKQFEISLFGQNPTISVWSGGNLNGVRFF